MIRPQNFLKEAEKLLKEPIPLLKGKELLIYVRSFLERAGSFLNANQQYGSPLYLFDKQALIERAQQFYGAFTNVFSDIRVFYAIKSNNHPEVAKCLVDFGYGLDVSSGLELELALSCGCRNIIFSGPGKTESELRLAAHHSEVTVLMDSFTELERLEQISRSLDYQVRAGVRLATDDHGLWRKFGVPLSKLRSFLRQARKCPHVNLAGLQFHTSWNRDPGPQVSFISSLGHALKGLSEKYRSAINFLDIGGGYWPSRGEWLQYSATPAGRLRQAITPDACHSTAHYKFDAQPIETFARRISEAVKTHVFPTAFCCIYTEPGRWLCDDAMHILLTVVDKKTDDLVITDAGTNIIGWERFEHDYAPIINLSRPSLTEHECLILGSLCTPHDVWGYAYFGDGIEIGDVMLIPGQGAYTYSLRQEFIKPQAKVVPL